MVVAASQARSFLRRQPGGISDDLPQLLDLEVPSKVYPAGMALTVSALAEQVGLSAHTIRYYERVGLLPEPTRSAAGYRHYDQATVDRLRLIKGAQRAGLRLREIGELLQVFDQGQCPCGHTEKLLHERLGEVRAPSWSACTSWRLNSSGCWGAIPTRSAPTP
jgi:DNA-binding transcriptional MerR regulator